MTRDEAIKVFRRHMTFATATDTDVHEKLEAAAGHNIDALVDLGVLKLDEPKDVFQKFRDLVAALPFSERHTDVLWNSLDRAGLKIVEK